MSAHRYAWNGWHDGATDCDPPEPGKEWLAINSLDADGYPEEEIAVVVLRTDVPSMRDPAALEAAREERQQRADLIVRALNFEVV